MKKLFLIFFLVFLVGPKLKCQFSNFPSENVVGLELSMFNRGLIGLSFQHFFVDNKNWMLSSGIGGGIGVIPGSGGINQFYYLSVTGGFGFETNTNYIYLNIGADLKYVNYYNYEYNEVSNFSFRSHYEGIGIMPFAGISVLEGDFIVQMRMSPLFLMKRNKIKLTYPGVGLTVGKFI